MYLYNLTIQPSTGIVQAVYGNFSAPKAQEIVVTRGKILELLRPDENGKIQSVLSVEIFGQVRTISAFRLTGGSKDYLIAGSDSGRIVILEYNPTKNVWDKIHQETFGKSGVRRIVPGQYLAADPKGRAVMIGAIEKQKLVYILNRDSAARLTISSPLEAHKPHTVVYHVVGVDVGFENPIFACLEVDYECEDADNEVQKLLTFYELDLGLNHVVRKWSDPVHEKSNLLISVPGGTDGPGGVLVCTEDMIIYKNQNHPEVAVKIPRRQTTDPLRGVMIVATATHKQKDIFFFLVQSEYGDLYKVTLTFKDDNVSEVKMKYFDTLPVCISLAVMKTGFLFAASEFGNHNFYQFQSLGDDDEDVEASSAFETDGYVYFEPRPLKNLVLIDEVNSLCPILDFKVADLTNEETPQLYTISGRGPRSSLKIMRHGLTITEMAVSPLPGNPSAIWTVRNSLKEDFDRYIVVSFLNATLVLSIGETVEESTDSGMIGSSQTLLVANIGEDGIIQIHPGGIRHIRGEKRIHEWKTPGKKTIVHATSNERQVVIALTGGDILYFELDVMGQLMEVDKKFMGKEVACVDIAPIPEGRQRTRFLAVGDWDNTVRIFSLDPEDCLHSLSVQALPTHPESLAIVEMHGYGQDTAGTLFLNIGLSNGVLLRSVLDSVSGELTDTRTRFLGARGVKLFKVKVKGNNAVLALSSRSWLAYTHQSRFQMAPLSYVPLEYASHFASEQCPEGMVSISSNTLRIISVDRLGEMFNQQELPLTLTPRRFVIHPAANHLVIIESDNNAAFPGGSQLKPEDGDMEVDADNNNKDVSNQAEEFKVYGSPKPGDGYWASCIRLVDPVENRTLDLLQLTNNEAALSICTCVFHDKGGEVFIVVGTGKDVRFTPRSTSGGFIHVYRIVEGQQLQLLHKTPVEQPPYALCAFQGRLLVGIGNALRIYDMGKKKLLRKCETRTFPNLITNIATQGDRIYVSDVQEGVMFVKYKKSDNQIYIFADQVTPRWVTSFVTLDYNTVAVADKFGNVMFSRLPAQTSDEIEEDPTGSKLKVEQGYLNGAPHKLEDIANFHVGDTINTLTRTSLVPGGAEALFYTTLMGSMGALLPFVSREDVDFFTHLEMHLRQENPPLCGRDHLSYRSSFVPVKNVIDGDLCEQFSSLDPAKQKLIAEELDRSPMEVMKKLEDIRNRLL
jgi:splicing factor 3B subunit 3